MAVAAPAQPSVADIISAGMKYGPNAGLAIQRSQYLANALQSLESSASQNIRTPTALWSNLLADGITQWGKNRADKEAMTAYSTDRAAQDAAILKGLEPSDAGVPAIPAPQADPSPSAVAPAVSPAAVGPVQIGGPPASPPPPTSNAPSPEDRLKLAQMVWGEARGEPPEGQQAVAAVAMNRLAKGYGGAKSLADVLDAPNQFEGLTAKARTQTPDKLASILANIQPELSGADPTGGAVNFYAPALQAQLGRPAPAWATGPSQTFGHQQFFGGNPQMAQATVPPPTPMPASAPPPGPPPNVAPYQVAANGPTPPPPTSAMGAPPPPAPVTPQAGAPPAAMPSSPGASAAGGAAPVPPMAGPAIPPMPQMPPQAAPQAQHGIPTGLPPTPGEMAHLRTLLGSPMTHEEGVAYGESLQRRMITPDAAPKDMMWDATTGRYVPKPGTQYADQPSTPNQTVQRDPFGQVHSTPNAAYGAVGPGMAMRSDGSIAPVAVQQGKRYRLPGALGIYTDGPDGKPVKVADDAITPKDLQTSRDSWRTSDDVKKANEGIAAYNGLASAIGKMADNNGVISTASVDSYLRGINPGMGAKNATVNMFLEHMGWPTELKSFIQSNVPGGGGGYITGPTMQYMLSTIRSYAGAHGEIAQGMADRDLKAMNGYGVPVTPEMLGEALTPFAAPPHAKWLDGPPATVLHPQAGPSLADIDAAIARKKQQAVH